MKKSYKAKCDQLGMHFSTATNRLRKMLLFSFVQKCDEDHCFKCGRQIESADDLSIEHKNPWFDNATELFWDLDNIAFSHKWCNLPHRNGARKRRKNGSAGQAWCSACKEFLPTDKFTKHGGRWNGYHQYCSSCRRKGDLKGYREKMGA